MNKYFRNTALAAIKSGLCHIQALDEIKHPVIRGKLREVFISDFLRKFSPSPIQFTSGKIVDYEGNESDEIDVIVHSSNYLPKIMIGTETAIVPIEACYYAFEVKTTLTANEIQTSIAKFKKLKALQNYLLYPCLVGFSSDLKNENEWQRYSKYEPTPNNPAIRCILSPGGYHYFGQKGSLQKEKNYDFHEGPQRETPEEYFLDFLAGYSNTVTDMHRDRGQNHFGLGMYLGSF